MVTRSEEDFDLELRGILGVINVGVDRRENGDIEAVTLLIAGEDPSTVRADAAQIASLYFPDVEVRVERALGDTGSAGPSRVALVRADYDAAEGVCEVHLAFNGRVGIGRSGNGLLIGGAEATLDALRDLGYDIPFTLFNVNYVPNGKDHPVVVTLTSRSSDADRFGVARAEDDMISAVKATLSSLNRFLSSLPIHP